MKRWWLTIPVILMLVGSSLVTLAVVTETGLRLTLGLATAVLPGELVVDAVHGRLIGPLSVSGLRYRDDATHIELGTAALDWLPGQLLRGTVHLQHLDVDGLHLTLPQDDAPRQPVVSLPQVALPLAVRVESVQLRDLRVTTGADTIVVDSLSLRGHGEDTTVELESLALRLEPIELAAVASVELRDDYPVAAKLDWKVRMPEQPAIDGTTQVSGSLTRLTFKQELRGAIEATNEGVVENLLSEPAWDMQVRIDHLAVAAWAPDWATATAGGTLRSRGTLADSDIDGELHADLPMSGPLRAELAVQASPTRVLVQSFDLQQTRTGASVKLAGNWQPGEGFGRVDLEGQWRDLVWPFVGEAQFASTEGQVHLTGSLDQYSITLETELGGKDLPSGRLTGRGTGARDELTLETIELTTLDGRIAGDGELRWDPSLAWRVALSFTDLNPGVQWPDWEGRLAGKASTSGQTNADGVVVDASLTDIAGDLRGYPVTAAGKSRLLGSHLEALQIAATSGSATLDASGSITDTWDLRWDIGADDLKALVPNIEGQATLSGTVGGPRAKPHIRAATELRDLRAPQVAIAELSSDIDVDLGAGQRFQVDIRAQQLTLAGRRWDSAVTHTEGTAERHRLTARLGKADEEVAIAVSGGAADTREWNGVLERADIAIDPWGRWKLAAPSSLRVGRTGTRVAPLCWVQDHAQVCAQAAQEKDGWFGKAELRSFPIALLEPWLPEDLNVGGEIGGAAEFSFSAAARLSARADFKAARGSIQFPVAEGTHTLFCTEAGVNASRDERRLQARIGVPFEDGSEISGRIELPNWQPGVAQAEQQTISGDLRVAFRALEIVGLFVPEVANVRGRFDANFAIGGTVASPSITGRADLSEGHLEIPQLGVAFEQVTLTVEGDPTRTLNYRAGARSGEGDLNIVGETRLAPEEGWPTSARISGTDFLVADIPEALVLVSPQIDIRLRGRRIDVDGEVRVPRARLRPTQLPEGTVTVSRDVVVVGRDDRAQQPSGEQWAVHSRVRVILGDRVNFDGFGLRGRLTGNLLVIDEPGQFTLGRGEFGISDGVYRAYGQNLKIERGRLIYASNPIDNPGLDVRATREVDTVTAGLRVTGTLQEPSVRLFSDPAMSESEALSYLVLGRPLNQASSGEGSQLMSAATALALAGGDSIARNIGARTGLEEIRVEETEATTGDEKQTGARIVLGRYLSPKLYIRYFAGLFEATNLVQLEYSLTRRIKIQTEAGVDRTGVDVFWTFER